MNRLVALALPLVLLSAVAVAATPEEVSKRYLELLRHEQWTEIAGLYDAAALSEFREMMSFLLEAPDEVAPGILGTFFGPGATKEGVREMSDLEFFSRFLRGVMEKTAELGQLDFREIEVLGSVPEGDSVRHVVARTHLSLGDVTMEAMEVISFRRSGEEWGILMQGKIKGMAQQIRKALERRQR